MGQKSGYHHGNLRAALLEAAFSILVKSGVEGLSLRGVARSAGVSPGAPYNHFKNKQAILSELAGDRRQRAGHAFVKAMEREATPRAKLKALGVTYVRYALEHQAEFKLMFGGSLQLHLPETKLGDAPILELFKTLIHEVDDRLNAAELDVAAITVWSQLHGLAKLLTDGPLRELGKDPKQGAALAGRVMNGLTLMHEPPNC